MIRSKPALKVLIWNAQSVGNKRVELFDFLTRENIDVALITETWLKPQSSFFHRDFNCIRSDRVDGNHGGVAIVIRKDIEYKRLVQIKTSIIENVGISLNLDGRVFNIFSAYFPGSSNSADLENFKRDINLLTSQSGSFLVGGDLNAKHRSWNASSENTAGRILFSQMSNSPFIIIHPNEPTHYPVPINSHPSTLDIILTNSLHDVSQPTVINDLSSDHRPVIFDVDNSVHLNSVPRRRVFNYRKADWKGFKANISESLNNIPSTFPSSKTIDESLNSFSKLVQDSSNKFIPKVYPDKHNFILSPEILEIIRERNRVRRLWQQSRDPFDAIAVRRLNYKIRFAIRDLRNSNWSKLLRSLDETGSRKFWRATKLMKKKFNKIPDFKVNGSPVSSNSQKANLLANHFIKSHELTSSSASPNQAEVNSLLVGMSQNRVNFKLSNSDSITANEIHVHSKRLKNSSSAGDDNISNAVIKNLPASAFDFLSKLFNACLELGYFPDSWKTAKIIPIPKPNKDNKIPSSYRPISLLPCLSKLFERCILTRITNFLDDNNIIQNEQFGFRKSHSTCHQTRRMRNLIHDSFNAKKSTGLVLLDLEKAFDTIWHNGLIFKMSKLNFPKYLIQIIHSFLSNRFFYVSVEEAFSPKFHIIAGVPQGAVLSPTLFNIFLFDIPKFFRCHLSLFADDTALLTSSSKPGPIIKRLQSSLKKLQNYYVKWKIKMNPSKTQCIYFTKKRKPSNLPSTGLKVEDITVEWSKNVKYLGLMFDSRLTFGSQFEVTCSKASKYIKILYPMINRKSQLSVANKILLYKAVFRAILSYGAPVWSECAKTHINKLQVIQNKCLKLALGLPFYTSTDFVHENAKVERFSDYCHRLSSKFFFNCQFSDNPLIHHLNQ